VALLLGGGLGNERAFADTEQIMITNPGFEYPQVSTLNSGPITGWSISGSGGVWNINADPQGSWTVPAPQGNQIAYVSPGPAPGSSASISQTLSATLQANAVYTLTGEVGEPSTAIHEVEGGTKRFSPAFGTGFTAELFAGTNLLASISGIPPQGSFQQFTLIFDSTGSPFIGQALMIELSSNQAKMGFDEITLTAQTTPEPSSLTLLLAIGLSMMGYAWRQKLRVA